MDGNMREPPFTSRDLLAAGYRTFRHHERVCDETMYQKVVSSVRPRNGYVPEQRENLYAIDIFFWYFDKHFPGRGAGTTASCEARMCRPRADGGVTRFTVSMSIEDGTTIEQIEQFFARAFSSLECAADPDLNNDKEF
jgi:hypothetical protein